MMPATKNPARPHQGAVRGFWLGALESNRGCSVQAESSTVELSPAKPFVARMGRGRALPARPPGCGFGNGGRESPRRVCGNLAPSIDNYRGNGIPSLVAKEQSRQVSGRPRGAGGRRSGVVARFSRTKSARRVWREGPLARGTALGSKQSTTLFLSDVDGPRPFPCRHGRR